MKTTKRPFATVAQAVMVVWLLVSMLLIGQQLNMQLYQIGLISLIVSSLSQIAVGNIPAAANFAHSMRMYAWFMFFVVLTFAISIAVAPWLASLGR